VTMRIRQVKPGFWTDAKLAELREPVRLFYIGLWMIADDAGWLRVDVPEIARDLYGFDGRKRREANVATYLEALVAAKRVRVEECGHALVVKLRDHQHLAGSTKQVKTIEREHARCAPQNPAGPRIDPPPPAPVSKGLGKVRNGSVGQGQEDARAHETKKRPDETIEAWAARVGHVAAAVS
jgi:hypothetical protein